MNTSSNSACDCTNQKYGHNQIFYTKPTRAYFQSRTSGSRCWDIKRQAREARGKSLSKLSTELGISKGRVHQREQASANLEIKTILEQAEALEYEVELVLRPKQGGQEIRALL